MNQYFNYLLIIFPTPYDVAALTAPPSDQLETIETRLPNNGSKNGENKP